MSDKMHIDGNETGVVRVFSIDLPKEAIERFTTQAGTGEWPLPYALGATKLRRERVDVVSIRDLDSLSLSAYLNQGYGISNKELAPMAAQLDTLTGHVLILPSQAFAQVEQTLFVAHPLRWIGSFGELKATTPLSPLQSTSAAGITTPKPQKARSHPKQQNYTLLVLIALLLMSVLAGLLSLGG